jgi:hypothetical protein
MFLHPFSHSDSSLLSSGALVYSHDPSEPLSWRHGYRIHCFVAVRAGAWAGDRDICRAKQGRALRTTASLSQSPTAQSDNSRSRAATERQSILRSVSARSSATPAPLSTRGNCTRAAGQKTNLFALHLPFVRAFANAAAVLASRRWHSPFHSVRRARAYRLAFHVPPSVILTAVQ